MSNVVKFPKNKQLIDDLSISSPPAHFFDKKRFSSERLLWESLQNLQKIFEHDPENIEIRKLRFLIHKEWKVHFVSEYGVPL